LLRMSLAAVKLGGNAPFFQKKKTLQKMDSYTTP